MPLLARSIRIATSVALVASCLAFTAPAFAGGATTFNVNTVGMSAWSINGQNNPPLTLFRGQTYQFVMQGTSSVHPFNINTTNTTGSDNLYNDGVTNNGASGTQTLTFVVPTNAPDSLHYNCGNHTSMNGPITIITDEIFSDGFEL